MWRAYRGHRVQLCVITGSWWEWWKTELNHRALNTFLEMVKMNWLHMFRTSRLFELNLPSNLTSTYLHMIFKCVLWICDFYFERNKRLGLTLRKKNGSGENSMISWSVNTKLYLMTRIFYYSLMSDLDVASLRSRWIRMGLGALYVFSPGLLLVPENRCQACSLLCIA